MSNSLPKVIAVVGPTAVGKTAFGVQLAQAVNGEVVSGDSMQVYRQLSIGTAKVTPEEMAGVPHHLIDCCDVQERYHASQFKQMATAVITDILSRGKVPIIVGGTGLYIEGLLYQMDFGGEGSVDAAVRQELSDELAQVGAEAMWQQLLRYDADAARAIPVANTRRVLRALEVIRQTGQPFSQQAGRQPLYEHCLIGLTTERQLLYDRINARVDLMLAEGLEAEARWLYAQDIPEDSSAKKGIGYKEWYPYFTGDISYDEAVVAIKQHSRHYAKRQLTWFRNRLPQVQWFDFIQGGTTEQTRALTVVHQFLQSQGR